MNQPTALQPPATPRRKGSGPLLDRVSLYLPVLLMVLLALASYLLLQATPEPQEPEPERPVTNEPDFFMRRFTVKVFAPSGQLQTEVYGTEARHHPDTDFTVIENARIRNISETGQLSTASAQHVVSNGPSTLFELTGNAVVVRQAGTTPTGERLSRLEFHGEFLRVSTEPEFIESDRPVLLVRDRDQITADRLDFRGDTRVVLLTGRVKATLAP